MPLFLHSRAASEDFEALLGPRLAKLPKRGLVHSFTGTMEEMNRLVALGVDVGVNGCSLKTEENLDVVKAIPLDRIQIETDGPWVCTALFSGLANLSSVRSVRPMLLRSTWRVPRRCRRLLRRRSGKKGAWLRAEMNLPLLLMLPMLLRRSRGFLWRRFVKRMFRVPTVYQSSSYMADFWQGVE